MSVTPENLTVAGLLEDIRLQDIVSRVQIYWAVCAAVLFWEFIITVDSEVTVVWRRKQWSALKILYLLNRYFAPIYMIIQLVAFSMSFSQQTCWHLFKFQIFGLLTIMTICESILIARVGALYDNSRVVLGGFAVYMLVQTSYCVVLCGMTKPVMLLDEPGPCVMLRPFPWFFTCFVWHAIFDTIIIVMTFKRTRKLHERAPTPLVDRIHNDGLIYYLALVSTNIFNIIPMAIPGVRDQPMINIPLSAITTTIMCTRLVLRLRQTASTQSFPSLSFSGADRNPFTPGLRASRRAGKGMVNSDSTGSNSSASGNIVPIQSPVRSWRSGSTAIPSPSGPLSPTAVKFHYTVYEDEKEKASTGVMVETQTQVEVDSESEQERQAAAVALHEYTSGVVARPPAMMSRIAAQRTQREFEMPERNNRDSNARRRSIGDAEKGGFA